MAEINELRQEIDRIDKEIAELYERRMSMMRDVAEYKARNGLGVFDKAREESVLAKNEALIGDPLLKPYFRELMQFIMDQGKDIQTIIVRQGTEPE